MDIGVLQLGVWILKLRTNNVVLLGGDIGKYLEEVGQGGNKGGGSRGDRDNRW